MRPKGFSTDKVPPDAKYPISSDCTLLVDGRIRYAWTLYVCVCVCVKMLLCRVNKTLGQVDRITLL